MNVSHRDNPLSKDPLLLVALLLRKRIRPVHLVHESILLSCARLGEDTVSLGSEV